MSPHYRLDVLLRIAELLRIHEFGHTIDIKRDEHLLIVTVDGEENTFENCSPHEIVDALAKRYAPA